MAGKEESAKAKKFEKPSAGNAGVYVYRDSILGAALKKDIWIDGECVGESAPKTFFYKEVSGDARHKIETESEFSPNALEMFFKTGENHFIRQYIKLGAFVGGANLEQMTEVDGKAAIQNLEMAKSGTCSSAKPN